MERAPDIVGKTPIEKQEFSKSFWAVIVLCIAGLSLTASLYGWVREWQEERVSVELNQKSITYHTLFQGKIESYIAHLDALRRFFEGSDGVDPLEFSKFARPVTDAEVGIKFFFWAPLVSRQAEATSDGGTATEGPQTDNAFDPSMISFPINYAEPVPAGWAGKGLDLLEQPACAELLWSLAENGKAGININICGPELITKFDEQPAGYSLIIEPVYEKHSDQVSMGVQGRIRALKGFVILAFDVADSYEDSIAKTLSSGIDVEILDMGTGGREPKRLYIHESRSGRDESNLLASYLTYLTTSKSLLLDIPSVNWAMVFAPIPKFYVQHYKWHAEFVAALSFLLTLVISISGFTYNRRYQGVKDAGRVSEENLKASRSEARAILETAVDGVLTIDRNGIVQSMNAAAERMFGYREEDVLGRNVSMLMPEPYRGEHDGYLHNYLRTGTAKIIGIGREVMGLRSNGEEFPMELSVSQFESGDGVSFAGIVRDITAQKDAMREVVDAREVAELANKAKSNFVNSMSHELRTPLNAVIGFSQLLAMDPDHSLSGKQKEYIGDITRSGELLLQLVSQVLDLSTIEAGKLDMALEAVDAGEVIEGCLSIISGMVEDKNVTIINQVAEGDHFQIRTDVVRLKQVMLNLLSNAVKYNKDGGIVTIATEKVDDKFLRISVTDTGYGLALDQQERVFEPFDRLGREALSIEGTGIGLTIAKNIMQVLGGRIGLASKVNEGTTFWVDLPT